MDETESPDLATVQRAKLGLTCRSLSRHTYALLAFVAGAFLLPSSALVGTSAVLAVLCAVLVAQLLLEQSRLEAQLFHVEHREELGAAVSGADWLAYHLAARMRDEQLAEEAHQAAVEAIAACEAAMRAVEAADAAEAAGQQVH